MSERNDINKRLGDLRFKVNDETHDRILSDALRVHADARKRVWRLSLTGIGRMVMSHWAWKVTLAGVAAVVAIVVFSTFGGGSLVLADVLEKIQGSSYSFEVTVRAGKAYHTFDGRVYRQGRARFDDKVGLGVVSTIVDLESRKSLLLFHQFKTARHVEGPAEAGNTGAEQLLLLCSRPMEDLWHLRNGTEEELGEETIDGVKAQGFCVVQEDEYFRNTITLWAEVKSALPVTVEIVSRALKAPGDELVFELEDFEVDEAMDAGPFSMEVPAGYTLSDRARLEDVEFAEKSSPEADKIAEAFALWSEGNEDEAIETLLKVDWDGTIAFAEEPYLFTLTEQAVVELEESERERVMDVMMPSCATVRKMCFGMVERAKAARASQDYAAAERYLETARQLGELLNRDPDGVLIVHLVGIAVRKVALGELKGLYEEMKAPEKVVATEQKIQEVDAAHQAIKEQVTGQ
jgi:outer membrane lipoprotein-sorting protein